MIEFVENWWFVVFVEGDNEVLLFIMFEIFEGVFFYECFEVGLVVYDYVVGEIEFF